MKVQQQLNRFFVSKSKDAAYLYKQKKDKSHPDNVLKGWGIELLNNYDPKRKDYDINFVFYITKVKQILHDLFNPQLNMFD